MNKARIFIREAEVSSAINAVISVILFSIASGLAQHVSIAVYARDFVPQSFMTALMGGLVPGLILTRKTSSRAKHVIIRSIGLAVFAAVLGLGLASILVRLHIEFIALSSALVSKAAYGAILGALVTVVQLFFQLNAKSLA